MSAISDSFSISTLYGQLTCEDELVRELINSPAFERLKKIRQYGTCDYAHPNRIQYNRYEHSLGVFALLSRYNSSRLECISGLLHDISHTVFSHATENLFKHKEGDSSYQDIIHEQFLNTHGIAAILEAHGLSVGDIHHKNKSFTALEQSLPEICADRLEYNLFAGIMDGFLTRKEIDPLLNSLFFENDTWFFTDHEAARTFARIPLYETINRWSSPEALLNGRWTSAALQEALQLRLITLEDIHYRITDDDMWNLLLTSQEPTIVGYIEKILNPKSHYLQGTSSNYTLRLSAKFRGINPWVKKQNVLRRLTDLDKDFNKEFTRTKNIMEQGWYLKA